MKKVLQSIVLLLGVLMLPTAAYAQDIYADVNGDLEVNIADINVVIDLILDGTGYTPAADVNSDGEINIADINVIIDIILGGGAHLSWYLVTDQDQTISMSRVTALSAVDQYTETFKVLDKDGNVIADQVKKVTFEFLDDAMVAHENNNHNTTVRTSGQDGSSIPLHKFLLSYQQDNQVFHESPEIITFQTDADGHYSWKSSTSTVYDSARDISDLDYVARTATSSVKLPDDAPLSPGDVYIVGNDGYAIDVQQDGTFTTVADYLVALDNNGNTLYLAYANSDVNDNMQVVTLDSRETALALLLPILPNIFETMPQEHLNKLKDIFWDVPEVKALAQAIDECIVSKGYLDMDYVDNAYQTAYNRLIVLLHLDTTYLSGGSTQMRGNGVAAHSRPKAVAGESASETAPQQAPQLPLVVYPYNRGIQLVLNDARYLVVDATPPAKEVMTNPKYIWQCDFELRNSNSFAYTSVMQGRLGPGGEWFNYVSDEPYETAIFMNILKAQKVSSFLDTFTTLDGAIEDLGNFFEDTWKLLTDSEYFFDEMTWDSEIKEVTFNMTTYDDIVVVAGPRDNSYVLCYNILKVAVEPILKMVAKKLLKGKGETYFEEKILIPFLTDFFFKMATDAELKAKFESIIYDQSLSNTTKVKNLADLLAPKLFDFVLKEVFKIADKEGKVAIQEMFTNMAKQFDSQGDLYDNVLLTEGELENLSCVELWSEVKTIFKWLDIIEKVGDATTGFLGLFEPNRTYEINLDFGDQLVLSDYAVVMPPNEKIVHIEMGKRVYDLENDNPALISVEKSPGTKGTYLRITRNDVNLTGDATITVTDRLLNKQAFIHVTVGSSNDRLYIEQQSLDLGEVLIGQTRTEELTIVNNTKEAKTLTATADAPFSLKDGESCVSTKTVVVPGNSCGSVTIQFTAATPGVFSGNITFTCAALDGGQCVIPVHAHAVTNVEPQTETFTVNGVSFKMVAVEGGTFIMGVNTDDYTEDWNDEKPAHQVTVSSFAIGQTEVTQALWQAVMNSNPSYFTGNLSYPVESVSWTDCQTFIDKLNEMTGRKFRLPTEAEWEFAAHGGNLSHGYKYSGSNDINEVAWYGANSSLKTHPVAMKKPNELALYDMSGNVWEWTQDWWGYYCSESQVNPTGPESGSYRVLRCGCWDSNYRSCLVLDRWYRSPSFTSAGVGLRLALSDDSEEQHDYVDLGLPSGTLWATCNVGANTPEGYGDYFAWGETAPKDYYDWNTYKWCNGSKNTMTKYCTNSSYGYNGFTDGKTELDPEDDAAYVNWGPSWRMPSLEQIQELVSSCNWQWTQRNGVSGRLFTGPNGNTLFLPAAGGRWYESLLDAGLWGYYWSRTLSPGRSNYVYYLDFNSGDVSWHYNYRRCGFSVRAVRVSQN